MYTRNVSMKLKANSAAEFTRTLENDVIPSHAPEAKGI